MAWRNIPRGLVGGLFAMPTPTPIDAGPDVAGHFRKLQLELGHLPVPGASELYGVPVIWTDRIEDGGYCGLAGPPK